MKPNCKNTNEWGGRGVQIFALPGNSTLCNITEKLRFHLHRGRSLKVGKTGVQL